MHLGGHQPTQWPYELTQLSQQTWELTQVDGTQFNGSVVSSSPELHSPRITTNLHQKYDDIEDLYASEDNQTHNRNDDAWRSRGDDDDDDDDDVTMTGASKKSPTLPQHAQEADQSTGKGGQPPIIPWDKHTVQEESMIQLGIVVNTELHIFTCLKCKQVIDPSVICKHILHNLPHAEVTDQYCDEMRQRYSLTPKDKLTPPAGLRPAIPNLELRSDYVYCSVCFHAVKLQSSLANKKVHSCAVYKPKTGYAQAYFPSHN